MTNGEFLPNVVAFIFLTTKNKITFAKCCGLHFFNYKKNKITCKILSFL